MSDEMLRYVDGLLPELEEKEGTTKPDRARMIREIAAALPLAESDGIVEYVHGCLFCALAENGQEALVPEHLMPLVRKLRAASLDGEALEMRSAVESVLEKIGEASPWREP